MTARTIKDKVQLTTCCGLVVSGLLLSVGFFTSYRTWGAPGVILGWPVGTLSFCMYFINLILAIYRNAARDFWSDWSPLNFGMVLIGVTFLETGHAEKFFSILASAGVIGLVISLTLYMSRAIDSRYVLIFFHLFILTPSLQGDSLIWEILLSAYVPYWELYLLSIAAVLVWQPIICTVTTVFPSNRAPSRQLS